MANLSQTAASVSLTNAGGARVEQGVAGEAITQGQPVYLLSTDSKHYQCDADLTAVEAACVGIALTPAATDEYFLIAKTGSTIDLGATLTVGQTYVVSATKGAVAPIGDLTTGAYPTILGVATTAGKLPLDILASGVVKP
jgi:hypothetical protein